MEFYYDLRLGRIVMVNMDEILLGQRRASKSMTSRNEREGFVIDDSGLFGVVD